MSDVFGNKLGQYILLEQLGEGGMAKVYNAFDSRLERNVAIKVILPSKRSSQIFLEQFEQEAKALANLTHTNIVKVLDYGTENEQPYLVMDFIQGGTLKQALRDPLPWQKAAEVLAPIARALDYVHHQKIVHRDIKPSNILLDENYHPMLSDFGVVQLMEAKEKNDTPAIGVGVGTPDYMSPEQGMGKETDFRADIYSLGVVFYELITGSKPFSADTPMAVVIKHTTDEFPLPRKNNRNIPKFVEDAILRAVQKDPQKRYADMGQFADALELIALGEEAPQKQIRALTRLNSKKTAMFSWGMGSFLALTIGVILLGLFNLLPGNVPQFFESTRPIHLTPQAICDSPPCAEESIGTDALVAATATAAAVQDNYAEPTTVIESYDVATPEAQKSNAQSLSLIGTPISGEIKSGIREIARWGIGGVNKIAWSPDGKTLAMGTTNGIFLYDAQEWNQKQFINTNFHVVEITFSPDGQQITAGSINGQVNVWESQTGQFVRQYSFAKPRSDRIISVDSPVTGISYALNGKAVAIGYADGVLNYFNVDQDSPTMVVEQYPSVQSVAISSDGRFLYSSNGSTAILAWDIANKKIVSELSHPTPINKFKLSNDRLFLLSAGTGSAVYLWDLSSMRIINSFSNLGGSPTDFDFSNDSELIVVTLDSGDIQVFAKPEIKDYSQTQTALFSIKGYTNQIRTISFSPTQAIFASGNWEEGLKIWNSQNGDEVFALNQSMRSINQLFFSADAKWLASGHTDNVVRVWQVSESKMAFQFEGYLVKGMPFSPDNRFLALIRTPEKRYEQEIIQIVELSSGDIVAELPGYLPKSFVQFTSDSNLLVMGTPTKSQLWDVATWEKLNMHGGITAGCGQFFTPQNTRLAVISDAGIFFNYDEDMATLCGTKPNGATLTYYFPKSKRALFVLGDGRLWDWDFNFEELKRLNQTTNYPLPDEIFLGAHQDGGLYAHKADGKLHIRTALNSLVTLIDGQDDYSYRVAFLPTEQKLFALGSRYGSIHIWTLP